MFKLFNNYPLHKLLKKVRWNARIMFIVYTFFIGAGFASLILAIHDMLDDMWLLLLMAMTTAIILLLFAPFLLYDYFRHKYSEYSLSLQPPESLSLWEQKIRQCEAAGDRLGISSEYLFSAASSFYIPLFMPIDDIAAVYSLRKYYKGRLSSDSNLYIITTKGKVQKFPLGAKFVMKNGGTLIRKGVTPLDEWIFSRIHAHAPHLFFGIKYGWFKTKDINKLREFTPQL